MTPKKIDTGSQAEPVACAVCGRRLLRGENPNPFLHGGRRVDVCDLCTVQAIREGWIREGFDELEAVARPSRGRGSLFGRLRSKLPDPTLSSYAEAEWQQALDDPQEQNGDTAVAEDFLNDAPQEQHPASLAEEPDSGGLQDRFASQTRATNATLKVDRRAGGLQRFRAGADDRGVARSLGAPTISVRLSQSQPSLVTIVASWEISWYRFEVDLSDEIGGAALSRTRI